ncbi:L-arabinose 1-dehydrogenase (NAD(P)(+)) [Candidatus Gugararchaeum adminiculabundum]|nr:L-arabinose 1-dehydrogenase (NAD(P)(+)) [Candidatus Gugararchaeum adminiculabundum]
MPKALVTGGAGFIGSHLVDRLAGQGFTVAVLDDFSTGKRENLEESAGKIKVIEGSILDEETVKKAVSGCELVFHNAAFVSATESVADPERCNEVNARGTLNVLSAAKEGGVKRFVFSSSSAVYGELEGIASESAQADPISPYGVSKLVAENYCQVFKKQYGISTIALRYFNVYGPRQNPDSEYAAVIPKFAAAAKKGKPLTIFGDGTQTRDFIYVGDVADANLLAAKSGYCGTLNVASGKAISINELAEKIIAAAGSKSGVTHAKERKGDIKKSAADAKLAKKALGFSAKTGLDEGLQKVLGSF